MKLLTLSNLYPNPIKPNLGVFVEQRLQRLLRTGRVQAKVLAPVPWFPFKHSVFGEYGQFACVPKQAVRMDVEIIYPRHIVIPKVGMNISSRLMRLALMPHVKNIIRQGFDFDVLDAHYLYPDGVAAQQIAKKLHKPCVMTARGSDVNLIAEYKRTRRLIVNAANNCEAVITVSTALKDRLLEFGVNEERIHVLRNGVDLKLFKPMDKSKVRQQLGISGRVLLSVGRLVELKGHHIVISALADLPDYRLLVIGDGPMAEQLRQLAIKLDVADRISFISCVHHDDLTMYFNAADATVLASGNEGMPNVLLESMACGTPVIATTAGGIPEVVTSESAGEIMSERTSECLVATVRKLFSRQIAQDQVRRHAEQFSWDNTVSGLIELFESVSNKGQSK
ncbi:MAG: glycosyltransferase family 4 protein [Gammaproteobacteria bacterium]|nr:glycosyltransferase family 4 protein [Gammaproteobacteria bacterium]